MLVKCSVRLYEVELLLPHLRTKMGIVLPTMATWIKQADGVKGVNAPLQSAGYIITPSSDPLQWSLVDHLLLSWKGQLRFVSPQTSILASVTLIGFFVHMPDSSRDGILLVLKECSQFIPVSPVPCQGCAINIHRTNLKLQRDRS